MIKFLIIDRMPSKVIKRFHFVHTKYFISFCPHCSWDEHFIDMNVRDICYEGEKYHLIHSNKIKI